MRIPFSRQCLAIFGLSLAVRSVLLGVLLVIGLHGVPYDTSSLITASDCDAAKPPPPPPGASPPVIWVATGGGPPQGDLQRLAVWDSVFFVRIARCGYEYEQFHAFFPLLPGFLRAASSFGLGSLFSAPPVHLVVFAGLLLSALASAISCVLLFRLTKALYRDDRVAALSALLYCCNPASVFHSALYSESGFALLSFSALTLLQTRPLTAAAIFGLATAARSNGIVSGVFIGHEGLRRFRSSLRCGPNKLSGGARVVAQTALGGALVAAPLLAFQYSGYRQFCCSDDSPPWCSAGLPYLYGYVQSHYWGVGFLRYFQLQQAPNFVLASPVLILSFLGCWRFVHDHGPGACLRALLLPGDEAKKAAVGSPQTAIPLAAAAYIVHWGFLAAFALTAMHVQVATRLLSTCPPLYWFAAHLCMRQGRARLVWTYFLVYGALGFILFPQFYPWT